MNEATDLPPIHWKDAAHALAWADEVASRPDCPSPTGKVINRLRGHMMRGSSEWTAQDYRDLAETVLVCWSMIDDYHAREALRAIHGIVDGTTQNMVAVELAKEVSGRPAAEGVAYSHISRIARAAMNRAKSATIQSRPYGRAIYAWALNLDRMDLYHHGWMLVIRETESVLDAWVVRGGRHLFEELQGKGLMGG